MNRVVLLHSSIGDSRLWQPQVEALSSRFEVVAPDLPGWGAESLPDSGFSFVDWVSALLPATLVGNSFGGLIALRTALARGRDVEKLVLIAPTLPDWEWGDEMRAYWAERDALLRRRELDRATELVLRFWLPTEHHDDVRPQQRRAFELQAAYEEPKPRWPPAEPLSSLDVPNLIVIGELNREDFQAIARYHADQIRGPRLVEVPEAGHIIGVEQPRRLSKLLVSFLGEGAAAAQSGPR
jgi:3-oxoadipate enol-lactonase